MNKIKQEKGITLVILIIAIIILIIIAGVAINLGTTNVNISIDYKLKGELEMVQHAVLEQYAKYKTTLNENYIIGTDYNDKVKEFVSKNYKDVSLVQSINDNNKKYEKYYLLNPEALKNIGIQDSTYSYIVNYYTGEVMNSGIYTTSTGTKLYIKGTNSNKKSESF